ncbi:MAG: tRNA (cytidine(56)-2'-O)-methyltransferase [Nitrosopumilaceae archaeon]|nr:tRNA (cytidine(56)-2'-O)-methyltransferase [Nitrosopumilaceae archaeon]NIT99936.1 tRNA (cytidine(56)-2'-O)-methyltransferase [Nitrosopumilaceae archaeon]NIU86290.1 tRNA (cytidine(56)-2'-O)-methyltransferase [Nitrosopumilaceae archaeon]NIV65045.1 tRNA (cytidine(56)-2'-O)-methyltransferase [Nitrosopumilaceae archaeon]NIX60539.1 tRNA (cytidine(56)-2'-O)-methyltransferase [Nitrosopumilaceae archaeon]
MEIEVLRIGQRLVRDDRVTTHVALVARAFGASKIYMNEINPEITKTIKKVNYTWGGRFQLHLIDDWKKLIKMKQSKGYKIIHLTMYGLDIGTMPNILSNEEMILVVVGAEKVPRLAYTLADYNVSIGSQPHSEISALAVFLDRIQNGVQFEKKFGNGKRRIIPTNEGKRVVITQKRD